MREPDASAVMGDTPDKGRTVMHYVLDHVAKRGRNGDDTLTHASKGDLNIPVESIKGKFKGELDALLKKHKIDRDRYTVGAKGNSVHPETGLAEFFGDTGAGDPGGAAGDPSGADMGGGPGAGPSSGSGPSGVGAGIGGGTDATAGVGDPAAGVAAQGLSPAGTTAKDAVGFLANPLDLSEPSRTVAALGIGAIPGFGQIAGPAMSVANMALHGVDQPNNPGGNLSAAQTGGVGLGQGIGTDPGAGPATAGGSDPVLDALLRQLSAASFAPGPR